jgi:hypothetical protein
MPSTKAKGLPGNRVDAKRAGMTINVFIYYEFIISKLSIMPLQLIRDLSFDLKIFKVLPDPFSGGWCIELRNPKRRSGEWVIIPEDPELPSRTLFVTDSHTQALAAFAADEIILGTMAEQGMPWFQALTAYHNLNKIWYYPDADTLIMQNNGWSFQHAGKLVTEPFRQTMPQKSIPWLSPSILPVQQIPDVLLPLLPGIPLKQVEYIFYERMHYLSIHIAADTTGMDQYMIVASDTATELCEKIESCVTGFSLDTWCIRNGILCIMRNSNRWQMLQSVPYSAI